MNPELLEKCVLAGYLLWTGWHDIRRKMVPAAALCVGTFICIMDTIFIGCRIDRMIGVIPGAILFLLSKITNGIGRADGIILIFAGYICGSDNIFFVFGISLLYIFFYSALLFILKRNRDRRIPYIPFLLAAYITGWKLL